MKTVVVVGNPKPGSRTRTAGERLARALGGNTETIELSELGPGLLGWGDPAVAEAAAKVQSAQVAIIASPTFKATYTGLLKLFLDQFAGGTGLRDVVAIPLMLGGGPAHALAVETSLRPVLVEIGAVCPTAGLYQLDSTFDTDSSLADWVERWVLTVARAVLPAADR